MCIFTGFLMATFWLLLLVSLSEMNVHCDKAIFLLESNISQNGVRLAEKSLQQWMTFGTPMLTQHCKYRCFSGNTNGSLLRCSCAELLFCHVLSACCCAHLCSHFIQTHWSYVTQPTSFRTTSFALIIIIFLSLSCSLVLPFPLDLSFLFFFLFLFLLLLRAESVIQCDF